MTEKVEDLEHDEMSEEDKIALRVRAYELLLPSVLGQCKGAHPQVAIAACVSAAATICVETIVDPEEAKGYFAMCVNDAHAKFDDAYQQKAKLAAGGGGNGKDPAA